MRRFVFYKGSRQRVAQFVQELNLCFMTKMPPIRVRRGEAENPCADCPHLSFFLAAAASQRLVPSCLHLTLPVPTRNQTFRQYDSKSVCSQGGCLKRLVFPSQISQLVLQGQNTK